MGIAHEMEVLDTNYKVQQLTGFVSRVNRSVSYT